MAPVSSSFPNNGRVAIAISLQKNDAHIRKTDAVVFM